MSATIIIEPRAAAVETEVDDMGRLRVVPDQIVRLGVGGGLRSFAANAYYSDVIAALGAKVLGYWPLWEASGTTVTDVSGNGRNGAYVGTYTQGQTGIGDGRTSALFVNGATSGANVYSAALAAALSLDEGWMSVWAAMPVAQWNDAGTYVAAALLGTSSNGVVIRKTTGLWSIYRRVGGTLPAISIGDIPTTDRFVNVIFEWSLSANTMRVWINGTRVRTNTTAQPSGMVALNSAYAMFGNVAAAGTSGWPGRVAHCLAGSGTLTDAQARVIGRQSAQIVFDGDSRSASKAWPAAAAESAFASGAVAYGGRGLASWGVSGKTVALMLSTAAADIDPLINTSGSNTISIWGGVNDNGTSTAQQIYDNLAAYCTARKAAGWQRVIVCTEIDSTAAGWNAKYQTLNTLIRNSHAWADAVADLGADARLQNASDGTYYVDGTHLTAAGYAVVAGIVGAVLA